LKIAGVHGADRLVLKSLGELARLLQSLVRQGDVVMAVQADLMGVGGFAVAEQIDAGSGFSLESAGTCIRCGSGRHEARTRALKKMASLGPAIFLNTVR
jgi:hypothetical protein